MKRLLLLILFLILTISVSGCFVNFGKSDTSIGREQAEEILRFFDENDVDGLKSMFCKEISDTHNLDIEITAAMDFFDGETISHDKVLVGGGESVREGKVVDRHIGYIIRNIKSSTENEYRISTHSYLEYNKNPNYIGITYLKVIDNTTDEFVQIGEYIY